MWENTGDDIRHVNCLVMSIREKLGPNRAVVRGNRIIVTPPVDPRTAGVQPVVLVNTKNIALEHNAVTSPF